MGSFHVTLSPALAATALSATLTAPSVLGRYCIHVTVALTDAKSAYAFAVECRLKILFLLRSFLLHSLT